MGLNQDTVNSWDEWARQNRFHADIWIAVTSGNAAVGVPAANLDADRWPTSVPSGASFIRRQLVHPSFTTSGITYKMTWQGNFGGSGPLNNSSTTVSSYDAVNRTCILTETTAVGTPPNGPSLSLDYTIDAIDTTNGTYPKNIYIYPSTESLTTFDPLITAEVQGVTSTGPIRFMKDTGVESNEGLALGKSLGDTQDTSAAWGGGTQSAPHYKIGPSNRTTVGSGEKANNYGVYGGTHQINTPINSGIPVEDAVEQCNFYNRDLWWNEHWNSDPAVVQYNATYIRDHLNSTLRAYIEIANEVWNPAYSVTGQAGLEAMGANRTDGHDLTTAIAYSYGDRAARYAEKLVEYHGYYTTVFAGARTGGGAKPTLKRVCAWWNAQGAGIAQALLDYQPPNATGPLHNYVDAYASAPYFDAGNIDPTMFQVYDPARGAQPILDTAWLDIDNEVARIAGIRAVCDARSVEYVTYEMSGSFFGDKDNTTCLALARTIERSAERGSQLSHFLQRFENASPGSSTCYYTNAGWITSQYGISGLKEYLVEDTSQTPKWNAAKDYVDGKRKLFTLEGTLIVPVGATVGTIVGYVRRRLIGSSITVNSAFSIVDPTATILTIKVADATAFTGAGTVNCVLSETGGTPSTTNTTTLVCQVTSATFFSPANSDSLYHIEGTNGLFAKHLDTNGGMHLAIANKARANGYVEYTIYNSDSGGRIGFTGLGLNRANGLHWNAASVGYESTGGLFRDGTNLAAWPTYANNDQIDLFLSSTSKLYMRKNNGAWVGADGAGTVNPSTDTGGVDVSAWISSIGGTGYPAIASNAPGFGATARFNSADMLHTLPTGASAWV